MVSKESLLKFYKAFGSSNRFEYRPKPCDEQPCYNACAYDFRQIGGMAYLRYL